MDQLAILLKHPSLDPTVVTEERRLRFFCIHALVVLLHTDTSDSSGGARSARRKTGTDPIFDVAADLDRVPPGRSRKGLGRRFGDPVVALDHPSDQEYMSEPGVVSCSPVSSNVFRPERIIGQPP